MGGKKPWLAVVVLLGTFLIAAAAAADGSNDDNCTSKLFPCADSWTGLLLLLLFYAVLLMFGAYSISEGSETLLEVVNAPGFIGGFVIPVLGAVPDAAVIVVSGALGTREEAQQNLKVGVGTLAGSTIMLLTIPWASALYLASSNIEHGESVDNKNTYAWYDLRRLLYSGTTVDRETRIGSWIMLLTAVSYVVIQGAGFAFLKRPDSALAIDVERWFALSGMVLAVVLLLAYSIYQIVYPSLQKKRISNAQRRLRIEDGVGVFMQRTTDMVYAEERRRNLYDKLRDDVEMRRVTVAEVNATAGDTVHENSYLINDASDAVSLMDGKVSPALARIVLLRWKNNAKSAIARRESKGEALAEEEDPEDDDDSDDEGDEGIDDDSKFLFVLPGRYRKTAMLWIRALIWLTLGTVVVCVFSDPIVDVITDIGNKMSVSPFFVSFVVTPFCSNASELMSSLIFASRRRKENSSLTYSALYGAATMNNTMCLGIFLALVFFRQLPWEFAAETVTILFVLVAVTAVGGVRRTYNLGLALYIISLYPFSIFLIWFLENVVGWN